MMRKLSPQKSRSISNEEYVILFLAAGHKTAIGKDIQDTYRNWQICTDFQKEKMNERMLLELDKPNVYLYKMLVQGFELWDNIQNEHGAPGWCVTQSSLLQVVKQAEFSFGNLLKRMNSVRKLNSKTNLNTCSQQSIEKNEAKEFTNSVEVSGPRSKVQNLNLTSLSEIQENFPSHSKRKRREQEIERRAMSQNDGSHFIEVSSSLGKKETKNKDLSEAHHFEANGSVDLNFSNAHSSNPFINSSIDLLEDILLRNLHIEESQVDSDFEKQVSPILSDDEELYNNIGSENERI